MTKTTGGLLVLALLLLGTTLVSNEPRVNEEAPPDDQPGFTEAEIQRALNAPGADASPAEIAAYREFVGSIARPAKTVRVTACDVSPRIAQGRPGDPLVFENGGSAEVTLETAGLTLRVPPQGRLETTVGFGRQGDGMYGITCNSAEGGSSAVLFAKP